MCKVSFVYTFVANGLNVCFMRGFLSVLLFFVPVALWPGDYWVIAHRGGAALGAENTLPCIEAAVAMGVDAVEVDVHLTRDGRVVLCHDAAVDATMDMTLSTIAYYYNPVSNETAQTITNFVIDGVTDIGQNELYSQNSYTNTASIPTQTVTKKPTMTKSTTIVKSTTITRRSAAARNYAHQKVGRLIGAI